ncbi:MAG: hypothetical protein LBP50_03915 [Tannerella sp.]|jgi:hypothetical protein|nr:hypothetical protein [Tannerella sp.]
MKSFNSTAREIGTRARHRRVPHIRYSGADFFSEGQEQRSEQNEKADGRMTETNGRAHECFMGHFNMFL